MIKLRNKEYKVIDAHAHIWNNFNGYRFGTTKIEPLGWGMVRQGDEVFRFLAPEYYNNQAPAEILINYMKDNGIDKAVILQNPCYGDQRDYVKNVIEENAGMFVGLGMIDPRDKNNVLKQMDILFNEYKFKGFKIEVPDVPFIMDDQEYDFLWKKIYDMGAVIALDLGWHDGPFDFNIDCLRNVMLKNPEMRTVICHLGVSHLWDRKQTKPYPELQKTLSLLEINRENLYLDISALPDRDISDDYPFYRAADILKTVKETCGMDRIMWGADGPMIYRYCTYEQTLTYVTHYCDFLTDDEMKKILYDNAQKVYFN